MAKTAKTFLIVIGSVGVLSGIYLAIDGADFSQSYYGIIIGGILIGSVLFFKDEPDSNKNK